MITTRADAYFSAVEDMPDRIWDDSSSKKIEREAHSPVPLGSPVLTGLRIFCAHCGKLLMEPGALLFSPPDKIGKVEKHHFCVQCFHKIGGLLTQENL